MSRTPVSLPAPLTVDKLRATCAAKDIPYADSRDIPPREAFAPPQPRALAAVDLALAIAHREYNIYVAGDEHLGRTYFATRALKPVGKDMPTPPDILYVCDFTDDDKPPYLLLPAGAGRGFRTALTKAVDGIRDSLAVLAEDEDFRKRYGNLEREFLGVRDTVFTSMAAVAKEQGFALGVEDDTRLSLTPLEETLGDDDPKDPEVHARLRELRETLMDELAPSLREVREAERAFTDEERTLRADMAARIIQKALEPVKAEVNGDQRVADYLRALEDDMQEHLDRFTSRAGYGQTPDARNGAAGQGECPPGQQGQQGQGAGGHPGLHGASDDDEDFFARYRANLLVDNSGLSGAPVVVEDHPTVFNLLGCIERESELGTLYTDFTLLKAGALHRAMGGFLVLKVDDVLSSQGAWDGLLRALRGGCARIEDVADSPDQVRTKTVEPEPLPLDLKVVLVGTDDMYEHLLYHDSRFAKLFKIKAHLQNFVTRKAVAVDGFLLDLAGMIQEAELPPFDREALAKVVDYASRLAEDQERLSLHAPLVRELLIEAAALARKEGTELVGGAHVARALGARDFRANLYEEEFLDEYDRGIIKVATSGRAVGRVNGLSVTFFGDYEVGLPHHIACTVGVGRDGILDLERESELGGPIHTKAMLILKSYLLGQFAYDKPLMLSGSLYFEQSYAEVEGDSASGAELAALLSALGEVPIDLSLAFTGAVNQSGHLMAVGGVTRKIEGYFEVCRRRGLTGSQGVIIPADNVTNLMLKDDVVEAVQRGEFRIYPASTVEEAMELLTGLPTGEKGEDGRFPEGSLYRLVDDRLRQLATAARCFYVNGGSLGEG